MNITCSCVNKMILVYIIKQTMVSSDKMRRLLYMFLVEITSADAVYMHIDQILIEQPSLHLYFSPCNNCASFRKKKTV